MLPSNTGMMKIDLFTEKVTVWIHHNAPLSACVFLFHQSSTKISPRSPTFYANGTDCSDICKTTSTVTTYRAGCHVFQFKHSNGYQVAGATTTTWKNLPICRSIVPSIFPQHALFTLGALQTIADLLKWSQGVDDSQEELDKDWKSFGNNCVIRWSLAWGVSKQLSGTCNYIQKLPWTGQEDAFLWSDGRIRSPSSSIALWDLCFPRHVGMHRKRFPCPCSWLLSFDKWPKTSCFRHQWKAGSQVREHLWRFWTVLLQLASVRRRRGTRSCVIVQ